MVILVDEARLVSPLDLLGTARSFHADGLGGVPVSDLPTVGLIDSLDTCMDHPPAGRTVRRGDHLPLPCFVGEAVANSKLRGEDLGVGRRNRVALLLRSRFSHTSSFAQQAESGLILWRGD